MRRRILVAHASRAGSTAEVAEAIGRVLHEHDLDVDVRAVKEVESLAGYDAVVLGTAIWAGRPLPEARQFLATHRAALVDRPVAYFALCEILRVDTPATRGRARRFLDPLRELKQPIAGEAFAGKKVYSNVHPLVRWIMIHLVRSPEGDWRDWNTVRAWAVALAPRLTRAERALAVAG